MPPRRSPAVPPPADPGPNLLEVSEPVELASPADLVAAGAEVARAEQGAALEVLGAADRDGRVARTDAQAGLGAAIVSVLTLFALMAGLDLDPIGTGKDLPAVYAAAFGAIFTALIGRRMNRPPK